VLGDLPSALDALVGWSCAGGAERLAARLLAVSRLGRV
jgi:hypothetical protein